MRGVRRLAATVTMVLTTAGFAAPAAAETDVAPPTVLSFDFTPKAVNLYTGAQTVRATLHLTDPSGVDTPALMVDSDTSTQRFTTNMNRVSGTATDGVWAATVTLSTAHATGPWTVSAYAIEDTLGNRISGFLTHAKKLDVSNSPSILPEPVASVTAVPDYSAAQVSWTASASGNGAAISGYTVTSSPDGITCTTTQTKCLVTGLTSGTEYTFTVVAHNANGDSAPSPPSNPVTPDAVPDPPTRVTVYPGDREVRVTWAAADGNGSPITAYHVTSSPGGFDCQEYLDPTRYSSPPRVTGTSCDVVGLTNGVTYTFTVRAYNKFGSSVPSEPSAGVNPAVRPGSPQDVVATPRDEAALISWQPPASDGGDPIKEYSVVDETGQQVCSTLELSCEVTGLVNGQTYWFNVQARNRVGWSALPAYPRQVTPYGAPLPPTEVTATPVEDGVLVSWNAANPNGSPVTSYQGRADGTETGCSAWSTNSCVVRGLISGVPYTFSVAAKNAAGYGAWSQPSVPATWVYAPHAEATVTVTPASPTATWHNGIATAEFMVTLTNDGPDTITSATVTLTLPDGASIVSQSGALTCADTTCTFIGALPAGEQVTANLQLQLAGAGDHTLTAAAQVTPEPRTPIAAASGTATVPVDTTAPVVKVASTPRFTTGSVVRVPWTVTESGSGVNRQIVETRRTSFGGSWTTWQSQNWTAGARETRLPLAAGYDYCYRVKAQDEAGNWSGWSTRCTARFLDDEHVGTSSGWKDDWSTAYWNNTAITSTTPGATAKVHKVQGNRVALLATRCPTCGRADVLVGGKFVGRVNLYAARTKHRQLIALPAFAARGGSLQVKVTSRGKRVIVDGIAVGRG